MAHPPLSLIAFRHHVASLVNEGAFKAPEDPLIYAIKERQASEISHRIDSWNQALTHPNFGEKAWTVTLDHLARLFYRDDILEADDYQFLYSVLSGNSRGILLTQLVANNCDGYDVLGGSPNVWIKKFLQSPDLPPYNHLETDRAGAILQNGRLLKLLSVHVPDPVEAAKAHLAIEATLTETARASRFNVELGFLKSAFGSDSLPTEEDADTWLEQYQIVLELRKENAKVIVGSTQALLVQNQIKYLANYDRVFDDEGPELIKRARPDQLEKIARVLTKCLSEDVDHLIAVLSQPSSKAIRVFGIPENKGGGASIPGSMSKLISAVTQSRFVEEDKRKQLLELMVVTLISTNHKNMNKKEVAGVIDSVKDQIDWKVIVASLNSNGRAALIDLMPDSKLFRAYLPRAERGRVLENDLGM